MNLSEATWTDIADHDVDVGVIPVGSCEQHGPHAPLGTDTLTATAVAERGIERYDGVAVQTPTIPIGVSEEHRQFPGTLWLTPDTLRTTVRDVVESLSAHGIDRVVIVNGHGGNVPALGEVAARVSRTGTGYVVPFTWFDAIDADLGHGGGVETAVLRDVVPDLVREDRVADAATNAASTWGEVVGGVNVAHDAIEFTANGVVGDPTQGDADTGATYLGTAGDVLARLLDHTVTRDWPPPSSPRDDS